MGKKYDGVDPRKAKEAIIDEELARLTLPGGGSIAKKIRRIREYVDENSSQEDWLTCETCGGLSCDSLFTRCPYCGDSETDLDPEEEPSTIDTTGETVGDIVVSRSGGAMDVRALDECVDGIRRLQADMWGNYHEIGAYLKKSHEDELWRLRAKDGSPAYKNFVQWAKAEVGLDKSQAYKCMGVAVHCSREDVEQFGHSKLGICFAPKLPPWVQDKLLEDMRAGASKHDLERRRSELISAGPEAGAEEPDSDEESTETEEDESIPVAPKHVAPIKTTVALTLTQQVLPMFARKKGDDDEPVPARTLIEDPWAELQLANDVVMRFKLITAPSGELKLAVACERLNSAGL